MGLRLLIAAMFTHSSSFTLSRIAALVLVAVSFAHAEENDPSFLAGLSFQNPGNAQSYAFLRWRGPAPAPATIHVKPGTAEAPSAFTQSGRIAPTADPTVIATYQNGMPAAIFDPAAFEAVIDGFFGEFIPAVNLTLPEKLAMVLLVSRDDPRVRSRLDALAVAEPFLAVCMGLAAVVPMPAATATFELRADDGSTVIGRVTVDTTTPADLPAPPSPTRITDPGPTGHLNVKLRWTVNDALLRATPKTFGYDVIRIDRALAESLGTHTTPPTADGIATLMLDHPAQVRRVNEGAVLAIPGNDPLVPFLVDDNGARFGEGAPFADGDSFYYHVAVRDLLGRPGPLSPGTLVTVCERMPPESPRRVEVTTKRTQIGQTTSGQNRLQVKWRPHSSAATNPPRGYRVSRWNQFGDIAGGTALATSVEIPHVPGLEIYQWTDNLPGRPATTADEARTYWYTVEAILETSCGDLSSGPSAPGSGALQLFAGPGAAKGSITASRSRLTLAMLDAGTTPLTQQNAAAFSGPEGNVGHISIAATRTNPAIVSFSMGIARTIAPGEVEAETLSTTTFNELNDVRIINRRIPLPEFTANPPNYLWVRATDSSGREAYAQRPLAALSPDGTTLIRLITVAIGIDADTATISTTTPAPAGFFHEPAFPNTGVLNPIELSFLPAAGTYETKLYRRIDDGPLMFISQTAVDSPAAIEIEDSAFPPYGARICYYVQSFDEHGNPSPLAILGCVAVGEKSALPVPVLERARSVGTPADSQVRLRWFSPPEGVERFRIHIADGRAAVPVTQTAANAPRGQFLTFDGSGGPPVTFTGNVPSVLIGDVSFEVLETGRVGTTFGDPANPGLYELTLNVVPGRNYRFYITAVSPAGGSSLRSNVEAFTWAAPAGEEAPEVPWPALALPAVDPDFLPMVAASTVDEVGHFQGIGIRIGHFQMAQGALRQGAVTSEGGSVQFTPVNFDATPFNRINLFSTNAGETVFPCVAYRYEIDPATGEPVTGNIVQVTPLVDGLWERYDPVTEIISLYNPHIGLFDEGATNSVMIKDTQPVIRGRTYRYLLVRFREYGEIDRVIPVPPVTVQP